MALGLRAATVAALAASLLGASCASGSPVAAPTPSPSPSPAGDPAALRELGAQIFPKHPQYGYYVSCVNFPENGAWPLPPAAPDYSACPITDALRERMTETRSDFVVTQTPWPNRSVEAFPRPGGGLIVVSLGPFLKVELSAVTQGSRLLVDEVVAKGEPPNPEPTPTFQSKPSPAPQTSPSPASGPTSRVLDVSWYHQFYELGCEEASLRMALAYQRIFVTEDQVFDAIPIDRTAAQIGADGSLRWGNPYKAFVGDPNGSEISLTGYGTYFPTIVQAAKALGGTVVASGEGISPAAVYAAVLAGHPVIAWVTYQWVVPARDDYVAFDGRKIPYAGPVEHAVVIVGVEAQRVLVNNPWSGPEWVSKATFEAAYATYNQMAVVLK